MSVPQSIVNGLGVGFRAQDIAKKMSWQGGQCGLKGSKYDFNMWAGTAVVTFRSLNGCANRQMFAEYVHTWDFQAVNSIGAGENSFSIGWETTGDKFEKAESGPSAYVCE